MPLLKSPVTVTVHRPGRNWPSRNRPFGRHLGYVARWDYRGTDCPADAGGTDYHSAAAGQDRRVGSTAQQNAAEFFAAPEHAASACQARAQEAQVEEEAGRTTWTPEAQQAVVADRPLRRTAHPEAHGMPPMR